MHSFSNCLRSLIDTVRNLITLSDQISIGQLFYLFFIVIQVQLSLHFSATTISLPIHCHLPPSILTPFDFVQRSFIHVAFWLFPFIPLLSPSTLLSGYCQFVLYSNVSDYIVCMLVCFVNQVPLIGEIMWYLSFNTWLMSFSMWNRTESPEINPCFYGQLIFNKGG